MQTSSGVRETSNVLACTSTRCVTDMESQRSMSIDVKAHKVQQQRLEDCQGCVTTLCSFYSPMHLHSRLEALVLRCAHTFV